MQGKADGDGAKIEIKCPRCKSVIRWTLGKPEIIVAIEGVRNHKRQTVVFE
jgi:phage FluMu protein Com